MGNSKFYDEKLGVSFTVPTTGRISVSGKTRTEHSLDEVEYYANNLERLLGMLKGQLRSGKPVDKMLRAVLKVRMHGLERALVELVGHPPDPGVDADTRKAQKQVQEWINDRMTDEDLTVTELNILEEPEEEWVDATLRVREDVFCTETREVDIRFPQGLQHTEKWDEFVEDLRYEMQGEWKQEVEPDYNDGGDEEAEMTIHD